MPQPQADRSAILAPGANYGADGPLLMYAGLAVQRRGGRTRPIAWGLPRTSDLSQLREQVASQVESAIDEMTIGRGERARGHREVAGVAGCAAGS